MDGIHDFLRRLLLKAGNVYVADARRERERLIDGWQRHLSRFQFKVLGNHLAGMDNAQTDALGARAAQ